MATAIQFLRSADRALRPNPTELSVGMPMVNYNADDGGLYFRLTDDSLGKVGTAHYGTTAPNTNALGITGNIPGELWVDSGLSLGPQLKFYDKVEGWISVNDPNPTFESLTVEGEVNLLTDGNSQVHVRGQSFFDESVSIGDSLSVTGSATFGQNCTGSFTVDSPAELKCDTIIGNNSNNRLDVFSEAFFGFHTYVARDLTVGTTLNDLFTSKSQALFKEDAAFEKNVTVQGTLDTTLAATFGNTVDIVGVTTVDQLEVNDIGTPGTNCLNTTKVHNTTEFYCDLLVGGALPGSPNVNIGTDGTVEAVQFIGDGSLLTNLSVPGALVFKGSIDATIPTAPAAVAGDFYLNDTTGTVDGSFAGAAGDPIQAGQYIYYNDSNVWVVGGDTGSAYLTLTTTQTATGEKTFSAPTHFSSFDSSGNGAVGGNLTVTATTTTDVLGVTQSATIGTTLSVTGATTLANTLSVSGVTTVSGNIVRETSAANVTVGTAAEPFFAMYATDFYAGDIHLNNKKKGGNDVDGTTGSWTLQEGSENIYLINNETGNKFKISMEAV